MKRYNTGRFAHVMDEDDAGEYVRYEDAKLIIEQKQCDIAGYRTLLNVRHGTGAEFTQDMVRLATQYTLTRTLETQLSKVLRNQIDAEVRKFWQAMETIKDEHDSKI